MIKPIIYLEQTLIGVAMVVACDLSQFTMIVLLN
jgi:hypothetical protein